MTTTTTGLRMMTMMMTTTTTTMRAVVLLEAGKVGPSLSLFQSCRRLVVLAAGRGCKVVETMMTTRVVW